MTHTEICEAIIKDKGCLEAPGVCCSCCPLDERCEGTGSSFASATKWLEEHKEKNMDKSEAMKRLDAIETEAKALREIIEKADKVQFDQSKVYVGIKDGCPYIMVGDEKEDRFRFNSFRGAYKICYVWSGSSSSAQECINSHIDAGFTIHAFDTAREAFEFFLKHLPL